MRLLKTLLVAGLVLFVSETFSQEIPENYQTLFNEIVTNFESIRTGNTVTKGKNSVRLVNEKKIIVRTEHKKNVKTLTFEKQLDKDNNLKWVAVNQLTIDMVEKYEEFLTDVLIKLHELSIKKAQE